MALAGRGIGYLPVDCVKAQLQSRELCIVRLNEPLPLATLVAAHEARGSSDIVRSVVATAQKCFPLPET